MKRKKRKKRMFKRFLVYLSGFAIFSLIIYYGITSVIGSNIPYQGLISIGSSALLLFAIKNKKTLIRFIKKHSRGFYYGLAILLLLALIIASWKLPTGLSLLESDKAIQVTAVSLTAASIIFSFVLIALGSREIQIGKWTALGLWLALTLLLLAAFGSYLRFLDIDTVLAIILSMITTNSLLFGILLLLLIGGIWVLNRCYYEEREGERRSNREGR